MASTIQIKRGTGSAVPSGLADGELAINLDKGQLYFGSGSTSVNSFTFKNLTAENYIVSSSVTHLTTQTLSGSTQFGNSSDDTHQFIGDITVTGDTHTFLSTNSTDPLVTIKNTTNDANGARLRFVKDKGAAGADNDVVGLIEFYGDDDNQDQVLFAKIEASVLDASNGGEEGKLTLNVASHDGELQPGITVSSGITEDLVNVTIGNGSTSTTTIVGDLIVSGRDINSATDSDLRLTSDTNMSFMIDADDDGTNSFSFFNSSTEIANLDKNGNLQIDGDLTVSGNDIKDDDGTTCITFDSSGNTTIANTLNASLTGNVTGNADTSTTAQGIAGATDGDVSITSDGEVTVKLDSDNDESSQKFKVVNNSGTERFSINESGVATFTGDVTVNEKITNTGTDNDLTLETDGTMTFVIDRDDDETGQSFSFKNFNVEVANLDESGNLQIDGDLTVSGNDIKDNDGTTCITFDSSGNTTIANALNAGGNLTLGDTDGTSVTITTPAHDNGNGSTFTLSSGNATAGQTDKSGGILALYSGKGTGTGVGSEIRFYTAPAAGSTGTSLQSFIKAATVTNDSKLRLDGGTLQGPTNGDLLIASDGKMIFRIDEDNDETGQGFAWQNNASTEIANLDESGNLQIDGDLTVSGNDIKDDDGTTCITFDSSGNTAIAGDLTVTGGDIFSGTDGTLRLSSDTSMVFKIDADNDGTSTFDFMSHTTAIASLDESGNLQIDGGLTVDGDTSTFSSANANDPLIIIKNTTNDADGAILRFVKDKGAAGAANDVNGLIQFFGDDANQDQVKFSEIKSQVKVHTNGQEGGIFTISVAEHDGTSTAGLVIEDGNADGELDATIGAGASSIITIPGNIDLAGDIDVDGTTNLDAVDIDGNVQLDGTFTVGVDDTGYDVTLFGATANRKAVFDASQDHLKLYDNTKLVLGTGAAAAGFDSSLYHDGTDLNLTNTTGEFKISTDTVRITAGTAGDANLILQSDTDDSEEADNPFMLFEQDGGAIRSIIGHAGANDEYPDATVFTGGLSNHLIIAHSGSGASRGMQFGTGNNARVTINVDGRVGIGTNIPGYTLDVSGDFRATGDIRANGNIVGDDSTNITNIDNIECDSLIHNGDTDTKLSFSPDSIRFTAGNSVVTTFSSTLITNNLPTSNPFTISGTNAGDTGGGDIVYFGGEAETIAAGQIVHYNSSGNWELADADDNTKSDGLLGVALGADASVNGVLLRGMVTLDHDPGAVGEPIYLTTTAGDASSTAPSGNGNIVRIIGYCLHATAGNIWFNPDSTFVEVNA